MKDKKTLRIAAGHGDTRPEILITHDLHNVVDAGIAALAKEPHTFQRGGALVQVVRREGCARTVSVMHHAYLRTRLASAARWMSQNKDGNWRRRNVPDDVVSGIYNHGDWRGIRELQGVSDVPTMRPDGTIVQTIGWDKSTGILFWPHVAEDVVEVPESPTLEHAQRAAAAIRDLVCDVPFVDESHFAVWLAALLTVLARPLVRGPSPMFAIDASSKGSGKSLLVDLISIIALGAEAPRTTAPRDEEEFRKRVMSCLVAGDPIVLVDNVTRRLGGDVLDALLTSTIWRDRLLGSTRVLSVRNDAVWFATGNNIQLDGDLTRRALICRLEPAELRPELRTGFKHPNLCAHVRDVRFTIVAQALTIMRAWVVAGRPRSRHAWGSYEAWQGTIGSAIEWLGLPVPTLRAGTEDAAQDDVTSTICMALAAIRSIDAAGDGVTSTAIMDAMYPRFDAPPSTEFARLRNALEESPANGGTTGKVSARALGYMLRAWRGRRTALGRLVRREARGSGGALWAAELAMVPGVPGV